MTWSYKVISTNISNNKHNCMLNCIKYRNAESTKITESCDKFEIIVQTIYGRLGRYMEDAIDSRSMSKMKTINIDLYINKSNNEDLEDNKPSDFVVIDSDTINTNENDNTTTHIYSIVKNGIINTKGQFMELIRKNISHGILKPLKFVFDRIAILNIQFEICMEYTPTFWSFRKIHHEFIGKSIYYPFTISGIKNCTYLRVYSQLLPLVYSNSILFNRPESQIPMY